MPNLKFGEKLVNIPSKSGAYLVVCIDPGETDRKVGEILYIGKGDNLRRRIAYLQGGEEVPHTCGGRLEEFQSKGGKTMVYYILERKGEQLESALQDEFEDKIGRLPKFNKQRNNKNYPSEIGNIAASVMKKFFQFH